MSLHIYYDVKRKQHVQQLKDASKRELLCSQAVHISNGVLWRFQRTETRGEVSILTQLNKEDSTNEFNALAYVCHNTAATAQDLRSSLLLNHAWLGLRLIHRRHARRPKGELLWLFFYDCTTGTGRF